MTDIEQKALALVNEIEHERGEDELTPRIMRDLIIDEALCRAIEQHEAFRKKVSDALLRYHAPTHVPHGLQDLIIPKPKPDPLVEVLGDLEWNNNSPECASNFRAALDARGLEIRKKNDDR